MYFQLVWSLTSKSGRIKHQYLPAISHPPIYRMCNDSLLKEKDDVLEKGLTIVYTATISVVNELSGELVARLR